MSGLNCWCVWKVVQSQRLVVSPKSSTIRRAQVWAGARRCGKSTLMSPTYLPFCTILALALSACASQTRLAEPVRSAVAARHVGRTVELRQSCYYGELYDENEKWLLSPHAFADTSHIVDLDGVPIHPTGQRGVVPAGTRFIIRRVEFPDAEAMVMRMLTTPRYNPWIWLAPAGESIEALPKDRDHFILLLPMDLETEKAVEEAIARVLAPMGEVTAWLEERRPTVRAAIEHKDIVEGMSEEELRAAMGPPMKWFVDKRDDARANVAWYGAKEAWLVDGAVAEVRDGRKVEPEKKEPSGDVPGESAPEATPGALGGTSSLF